MEISWIYQGADPIKLKTFLAQIGISRRLRAKMRREEGELRVNGQSSRKVDKLQSGDQVTLLLPPEQTTNQLSPSFVPITVVYEDRDFLIVNKPAKLASIPAGLHPDDSLMQRLLGYFKVRSYRDVIPHIMTRLDRDTSGLVLVAKHSYAQAFLEQVSDQKAITKRYYALVSQPLKAQNISVNLPIGRNLDSLYQRKVTLAGKVARTDLTVINNYAKFALCDIKLFTGRTHQIRVHCQHLGHPLIGDQMYQGPKHPKIQRQALHCYHLSFYQPFLQKQLTIEIPLPADMMAVLQ